MSDLDLEVFFEKKFSFENESNWTLPPTNLLFSEDLWTLNTFQLFKTELNQTKSLLNDKGQLWLEHTIRVNKAKLVIETIKNKISPDILTQAWCKFYEILSSYLLIPAEIKNFKSLHLCEAPGAFISALNCYLHLNNPDICWDWLANTLNPYYEGQNIKSVIVDDRLIFPTLRKWHFGSDSTGDIMHPDYPQNLRKHSEDKGFFNLVTADGSVNCLENPAEQELVVSQLQFSEMVVALSNLAPGGSFVLKKFTFFECETICKMYFLNCVFEKVHVFKPFTSKHGNSEVYVICLGYQGVQFLETYFEQFSQAYNSKKNKALFPLSTIPESFISQLIECSKFFGELQKNAILENIELFSQPLSNYETELTEIQRTCAEKYSTKCAIFSNNIFEIPKLYSSKKQILTSFYDNENRNCKILFYQALGETYENLSKLNSMDWPSVLKDVEKRLNVCFPANRKRPHKELEWSIVWKDVNNRMKSKSYKNWVSTGKRISRIQNSKFCNPYLLHLWNRISIEHEVEIEEHMIDEFCYWDLDALLPLMTETINPGEFCLIFMQEINDEKYRKDPILAELLKTFSCSFSCDFSNEKTNFPVENRIIYINSTLWENSQHQEIKIKHRLTEVLKNVIKILNEGDTLVLCIQSLFTRYTIGIIFMLLSLFEKFVCTLPNDIAPPISGQLWTFKNYKKPAHTNRLFKYMETVLHLNIPEDKEILETVPIASLCGGYFYQYLLALNNKHMLQRLRSLISIEKSKLKKSVNL